MADWLHRPTKQLVFSTPPTELLNPIGEYIEGPDLSAVVGFASKYWIITGDLVTLMDQASRDAVDVAEAAASLLVERAEAIDRVSLDILTRETVEALLFEINKVNTRVQELQDALTAVKDTSGGSDNIRAAIPDPSVTENPAPAEFTNVNPKLRSEVLQAMVDDINAGVGDP